MGNYNTREVQIKNGETQAKLEKMRSLVLDEQKCKEIAQKLCAYISSSGK